MHGRCFVIVLDATRCVRKNEMEIDNLFDIIEPLDKARHDALMDYCTKAGISDSACEGVIEAARLLRDFELYEKPNIQTTKEKIDNLNNIADLSKKLQHAIANTARLDKVRVHEYIDDQLGDEIEWPDTFSLDGVMGHISSELRALALAATDVANTYRSKKKNGGRRSLVNKYYFYLDWIWKSVENEGFVIGRNNSFERLCDAVFLAAGVHAGAAGSVRYFSENYVKIEEERNDDDF